MTFEELLERDGVLVYKTRGVSMLPMLHQDRDLVTIEVPRGRLKPLDVALYRRGGAYVLHRVVRACDGYYLIRGDNTYCLEKVSEDAVIGVLTGFLRGGKRYSADDRAYRAYARVWDAAYPLRYTYVRARGLGARVFRTVKKVCK